MMTAISVGIIDPFHPRIIDVIREVMPASWTLIVAEGRGFDQHVGALAEADVAFVMATPMQAALLERAPKLGFIQKLGAGVDRIDLETCAARGIGVARLQAGNSIPVAEHTLLMMLAACRRLPFLDRETRAGGWDKEAARGVSRQINGKTVGIVGFGAIGRGVARLLSGFGCEIIYFDPVRAPVEVEQELGVSQAQLDELLARADIISLHLPLMPVTAGLISEARIAAMKPGAILINCARGGLVDEAALHRALTSGHLFAAGLDAFSEEPPIGNPLLTLDQTVVTPHVAGGTVDNFRSVAERAVANTELYLTGQALPPDDLVVVPRRLSGA
jgi:D-3-phosphoglycerate dehydrogenase